MLRRTKQRRHGVGFRQVRPVTKAWAVSRGRAAGCGWVAGPPAWHQTEMSTEAA